MLHSPNSRANLFTCAECSKSFERAESKHVPFCSQRCQQIDLAKWLREEYGLPFESDEKVDFEQE
ncbi:MAG TPA: DNA gyrase inhibitor YacG [Pirellulaceae bacterium]|nr:DNA gyrase inhibitor YacG [Pirellulaceae bacterium]HMO93967.1 DNA gyrase inhibitor YacG [Pirellulaceae bacterium]HMP70825.1 DNA gyrase inhibitor YacG [Pirellulaceae bacterium]